MKKTIREILESGESIKRKDSRRKKKITTNFDEEFLQKMDSFCIKNNLMRNEFIKIAVNHYIASVEEKNDLLLAAYNSVSEDNWIKNSLEEFLANLLDIFLLDYMDIYMNALQELELEENEGYVFVKENELSTICKLLILCIQKQSQIEDERYRIEK